jgi:endoglycosylceramidase
VDEYNREWLFRGMNARITDILDLAPEWEVTTAPYDEQDAQDMTRMGFNLFRLCISWSGVEPEEGHFDEEYLKRIDEVVALARDAGIYVLIDFHTDGYSKYIGDDGAPEWAHFPPVRNVGDKTPQEDWVLVYLTYQAFFANIQNLHDRFLPAWKHVAARYADQPNVVGFEVMNEPRTLYFPIFMEQMWAFYRKAATALREVDMRHTLWLEPDVVRNFTLRAPVLEVPFPDENVVYAPHVYPNLNGSAGMYFETVDEWIAALTETFDLIVLEGASWGGATLINEWGSSLRNADYAPSMNEAIQKLADKRSLGLAYWLWKEKGANSAGLFDYDNETESWTERTGPAIDALIRPSVIAVPGRLHGQSFDRITKRLEILFKADGGEGPPLLFLPKRHFPGSFRVELNGKPIPVDYDDETQRALLPWEGQAGEFEIVVQ